MIDTVREDKRKVFSFKIIHFQDNWSLNVSRWKVSPSIFKLNVLENEASCTKIFGSWNFEFYSCFTYFRTWNNLPLIIIIFLSRLELAKSKCTSINVQTRFSRKRNILHKNFYSTCFTYFRTNGITYCNYPFLSRLELVISKCTSINFPPKKASFSFPRSFAYGHFLIQNTLCILSNKLENLLAISVT